MSFDPELEAFKTQIDLRQYAAALGFRLDRERSSRSSAVMRRDADKIIVKCNASDGHFVYFTVHDDTDNGSIIDFAMNRLRRNIGEVRKELRPWIGRPAASLLYLPPLEKSSKDRGLVETQFERTTEALRHSYLEDERDLSPALLRSSRFAGRIRVDERGNTVFPHFDKEGLAGFEKKNLGYTGFVKGGEKALWFSRCKKSDIRLVFCESGIEAISYAQLFPNQETRYASIGGEMNSKQPQLIDAAIQKMATGSEIVAAFNADQNGRSYASIVASTVENAATVGQQVRFLLHEPEGFKDWNDQVRGLRGSFPTVRFEL